jgi:hypothetical protein
MSKYVIISDVHYEMERYLKIVNSLPKDVSSIQIGDLLIGLPNSKELPELPYRHKFLRGNHDCPKLAKEHPNYLGDYGCIEDKLFYVSGCMSPDYRRRTEGKDWWPDEQLNHATFWNVLKLYEKKKPKIVVTHEAPHILSKVLGHGNSSLTQHIFEMMTEIHKPEQWIVGHFHRKFNKILKGIQFKVLPFLGTYELEI